MFILSGERLEPVYFDFHVQRQIDLLALEILTCTNNCFEPDQNVTLLLSYHTSCPQLDLKTHMRDYPLLNRYNSDMSHTINVMKWFGFSCILAF